MSPLRSRRKSWLPAVLSVALSSALPAQAAECLTRTDWPTEAWPEAKEVVATERAAQLKALEDYAFTLVGKDEERKGVRTDGLLLIHKGRIIYERYGRGFDASKRCRGPRKASNPRGLAA